MRWHSTTSGVRRASSATLCSSRGAGRMRTIDAERESEGARVDVGAIARDHAALLQARDALRDRGRGQADAPAQLGEREPRVLLQLAQQAQIGVVEGGDAVFPSIRRHGVHNSFDRSCNARLKADDAVAMSRSPASARLLPRQRGLPLPRPGVRGAAVRARRRARRGLAADRRRRARVRALAAALADARARGPRRPPAAARVGGGARGDELQLLPRHRPTAAGTVAAIEFLPVVALAALGARTPRNLGALLLAVPGVYLLTGVQLEGEALGVALAFVNAGPVRALHRAGPPGRAARRRSAASTAWPPRC